MIALACLVLFAASGLHAADTGDWERRQRSGAYVVRKGDFIHAGNSYLERVFRTSGQALRTVALINKVSGAAPNYRESVEFALEVEGVLAGELTAPDFRLEDVAVAEPSSATLETRFTLRALRNPALTVRITIETRGDQRFARKWLDVDWQGPGDLVVKRIDVEAQRLGWWNIGRVTHSGYGQPLFAGDIYLGLEYPGAETSDGWLRHFPGRSAKGGLRSKPAVWGVAADAAQVPRAFLDDYLRTVARAPRPFVIYNLLDVGMPEEKLLLRWVDTIGYAAAEAGLHIDSFAVDDGWQDESTVWETAPWQFPHGFGALAARAEAYGARLGVWLSLPGHTLDTRWGARNGLEVAQVGDRVGHGRYCMAGAAHSARLRQVLDRYLKENHVNYFKCDYNTFACDNPSHGHPAGRAGKDAQIDAYIEILKHIRAVAPDTFVALTSGMWLSPWWTAYADSVWLGGNDRRGAEQYPGLSPHDLEMTYRDTVMYDDYVVKGYPFPFRSLMTHGFWTKGDISFSKFQDDAVMTIGRGIAKWEILTSPEAMDAKRYAFLAQVVGWGKANWDILSDTRMILGDPGKGEVYGYAHHGPGASLIFLRNPGLPSRMATIPPEAAGVPAGARAEVLELYPAYRPVDRSSTIAIEVPGTGTKCVAVVWDVRLAPRLKF